MRGAWTKKTPGARTAIYIIKGNSCDSKIPNFCAQNITLLFLKYKKKFSEQKYRIFAREILFYFIYYKR